MNNHNRGTTAMDSEKQRQNASQEDRTMGKNNASSDSSNSNREKTRDTSGMSNQNMGQDDMERYDEE